jgi:hypothetical protein
LPFGGGRRHRARSLIGRVINSAITVLTRSRIPLAEARVPTRRLHPDRSVDPPEDPVGLAGGGPRSPR